MAKDFNSCGLGEKQFSPFSSFYPKHLNRLRFQFNLFMKYPIMFSDQFSFPFISTDNFRSEIFPTDVFEPELSTIYSQPGTFYDFIIDTVSTCTICTFTVV